MIIDLDRFIREERRYWTELEEMLDRVESEVGLRLDLAQVQRFHYLYQRASADLARLMTFASAPEIGHYLESLVKRAYGEIHETRAGGRRLHLSRWFFATLPQTFRRRAKAFWLALAVMLLGSAFGGLAVSLDPEAKDVLMPWPHLRLSPSERVAQEEEAEEDRLKGAKASFSSYLMTHNIKVSIFVLALGITWGVGTMILLFYNGVILGAVALDYILAGQAAFLAGWLLPHGSIEIPAILVAGQAGLVLAGAAVGRGEPLSFRGRMRRVGGDLVTLICGAALFLVWAGIVESFFSQYHEPVIPYAVKIGFGAVELALLVWFLSRSGLEEEKA